MPRANEICRCTKYSNTLTTFAHETSGLVSVNNNQVVTTSLQIAEFFDKEHKSVLRQINSLECSDLFRQHNFALSCYTRKNGNVTKSYPMYYITKDGFTILAMGFTGKIAVKFKESYINAFNEMERVLASQLTSDSDVLNVIKKLIDGTNNRLKRHDKQLIERFGTTPQCSVISPSVAKGWTLEQNLQNIFASINNKLIEAQYDRAKLEALEKEHERMKKSLSGMANEFLSYY